MCPYIYEALVQTFNLPQPSECAERRLSRCGLSPPSPPPLYLPAFLLLYKSFSSLFHRLACPHSLVPAPHAGANFNFFPGSIIKLTEDDTSVPSKFYAIENIAL